MSLAWNNESPAPTNPPAQKPRSPLQKAATDLGETVDHLIHLDGVRWDIENGPDGRCLEKGVFSDAFINPNKIKEVYLLIKPFVDQPMNLPGHALLNFEFEPDAPMTPKTQPDGSPDPAAVVPVWCPNTFAAHGLITHSKPDYFPAKPLPPTRA